MVKSISDVPVRDKLIPNISIVKIDFVSAIESTHLVLKHFFLVMLFLMLNVFLDSRYLSKANREGRVSVLPTKLCKYSTFCLDPLRRIALRASNESGNEMILAHRY